MCVFRLTRFGDRGHGVCDWFEVCVWGEYVGGVGCVLWNKRQRPRISLCSNPGHHGGNTRDLYDIDRLDFYTSVRIQVRN